MKKLITVCIMMACCGVMVFIGCKKNNTVTYYNQGVISPDLGYCITCGGYLIKFNSDTTTSYHIANDITRYGITINSKFPINVSADWQVDDAIKTGNYIIITQLKVIN
jgi:hypothetical protein